MKVHFASFHRHIPCITEWTVVLRVFSQSVFAGDMHSKFWRVSVNLDSLRAKMSPLGTVFNTCMQSSMPCQVRSGFKMLVTVSKFEGFQSTMHSLVKYKTRRLKKTLVAVWAFLRLLSSMCPFGHFPCLCWSKKFITVWTLEDPLSQCVSVNAMTVAHSLSLLLHLV